MSLHRMLVQRRLTSWLLSYGKGLANTDKYGLDKHIQNSHFLIGLNSLVLPERIELDLAR